MSSPEQFRIQETNSQNEPQRSLLPEEFHAPAKIALERTGQTGQGQMYPPGYVPGVSDVPPQGYTGQQQQQQYNPGYQTQPGYSGGFQPGQPQQYQVPADGGQGNPYVQQQPGAVAPTADQSSYTPKAPGFGGGNNGGGDGLGWYLDRGLGAASTAYHLQKFTPELAKFIPEGAKIPTLESFKAPGKEEWMTAAKADLGKVMIGSWIGDTVLDKTLLNGKTTSWKTMAVDIGTPLLANTLLGRFGFAKTLGITIGAHALEKIILEDNKQ